MNTLTLKKIPHIIIKSDLSLLEQEYKEQQEMLQESQKLFEFSLRSSAAVGMVFQRGDYRHPIKIKYHINGGRTNLIPLSENLRYFQFNLSEVKMPESEISTGKELPIVRKVRLLPVGSMMKLHDQLTIMPLMQNIKPDQNFLVPLTQEINILTPNYKWKHLLTALVQTEGKLTVRIQKVALSHFDVNYALQCLNQYTKTYQGKLSPEEIERNTKIFQAIISGEESFSVRIYVESSQPEAIKQAFLQDMDVNAFSLYSNENAETQWSYPGDDEMRFIQKIKLLWSLNEVLQLLTPPYTFRDALPGMEHFVPKPFLLPFMDSGASQRNKSVLLGTLDNGRQIFLSSEQFKQHIFVTGTSGAGKTHTVHHLLSQLSGNIPLLIIDPAKREYENLMKKLGKADKIIDFKNGNYPRFNPFIAPENITIYSHSSILARTLAILFPTNEVAYELLLQMIRQTYFKRICHFHQETLKLKEMKEIELEEFLNVQGSFFRQNTAYIPSFQEFLGVGMEWLKANVGEDTRWGQEAVEHFTRRWKFLRKSILCYIFSGNQPVDRYFESDYLIELYNILDANERNVVFAVLVSLLYTHRKSDGLQGNLTHLTVLEEAHQIIPSKQPGLGENMVSSPAHKASKLLADMLAEIRGYGEGIIVVDQSASKIIPDVLINSSTKIIHRVLYGSDKQTLSDSLSLTSREMDYFSYLPTGSAITHLANVYQPIHLTIPNHTQDPKLPCGVIP